MKRALLRVAAILLMAVLGTSGAQATLLEEALASFPANAAERQQFSFVVLGDSRYWEPVIQPETFREIVREASLLRGALMIDIGDLILGYTGDAVLLGREWDEFEKVVRTSHIPFVPVVGNHDVSAPMHEEVYQQRIGKIYFSFDYGNAHFICLDGDQIGYIGRIGPEQVAWLAADLEATKAEHIFVFLHEPLWRNAKVWDPVHALLGAHRVDAVFAGHEHHYELFPVRDGVRYFISGGGGAEIGRPPESGGFHHFMWVVVDGPEVHYAVVKPGAILPVDVIEDRAQATLARLETEFDGREIALLAQGMAKVFCAREGPVMGAAQLARESQGNLRKVALALIANLANTDWVAYLPAVARDADPGVAKAALEALLSSSHPQAVAVARGLLTSSDEELARRAALALALNDPEFPQSLREAVGDPRRAAEMAESVVAALEKLVKVDRLVPVCEKIMEGFPEAELFEVTCWVRWREARALQRAGRHAEAIGILDEILRLAPRPDFSEDVVPDSLILKARSLAALGQKEEALALCKRLQQEFAQYSGAAEAAELAEELQAQRDG